VCSSWTSCVARSLGAVAVISERSKTARRAQSNPPRRRRQARARRTTAGVEQAGVDSDRVASMIPAPRPYLAPENPIGPPAITEDQREQHRDAEQQEDLAVLWRGRLPDRDALRHDERIYANGEPGVGERKQRK